MGCTQAKVVPSTTVPTKPDGKADSEIHGGSHHVHADHSIKTGPVEHVVEVKILSGYGFPGASQMQLFCKVEVPNKPESKHQTPALPNCGKIEWGHVVQVNGIETGDSLEFAVVDYTHVAKSTTSDGSIIGTATLDWASIKDGFEGTLCLKTGVAGVDSCIVVNVSAAEPTLLVRVAETAEKATEVYMLGKEVYDEVVEEVVQAKTLLEAADIMSTVLMGSASNDKAFSEAVHPADRCFWRTWRELLCSCSHPEPTTSVETIPDAEKLESTEVTTTESNTLAVTTTA